MTTYFAIREDKIVPINVCRDEIGNDGMVESVSYPRKERVHAEKGAFLPEEIELRIAV